MIRTLIVDDEPLARHGLRARLEPVDDIEIVGEAGDGPEAVEAILSNRPDLVLLDIQVPGLDGFQIIEQVAGTHFPLVVFVTAFDEFAVRAFEVHAIDYLLKPVTEARLAEALSRVRREISHGTLAETQERVVRLLDTLATNERRVEGSDSAPMRRFLVKEGDRHVVVRDGEIRWMTAAGNYVELHLAARSVLLRMTLVELERRLDPARFARIHRSIIVALDEIREIVPEWHGDSEVILRCGQVLRMSRSHRSRLLPPGRGVARPGSTE